MTKTTRTTYTTAKPHDDRRFAMPSKSPTPAGEMTHMILITIAAALLTGVVALLLTMPGRSFAEPLMAFGAADLGQVLRIWTSAHLA